MRAHAPTLAVYQRGGINLGPALEHYDPEPDVLVVDAQVTQVPDKRYADRFYLAAEVVSSSDRTYVESKRGVYKQHDACACVITVQQERAEGRVDLRTDAGWTEQTLTTLDDALVLPDFGLRCKVVDVYLGTPLAPHQAQSS